MRNRVGKAGEMLALERPQSCEPHFFQMRLHNDFLLGNLMVPYAGRDRSLLEEKLEDLEQRFSYYI